MKWWSLLLLLLMLLPALGCAADGTAEMSEAPAHPAAETAVAAAPTEDLTAARTQTQPRPLTEEELLSAYERAVTACGWFDLSTMSCEDATHVVDGREYHRVSYRGMEDLEDLRTYLRGLFSQEVTDRLLATGGDAPLYREIDGALYVLPTYRSRDRLKGNVRTQTEQSSQTAYAINVAVDILDADQSTVIGAECHAFPYELVEERWVFTEFHLVF